MGLLILFFLMTVVVSFTCSLLESILLSTSPAYIALKVKEGRRSGVLLGTFKEQIDRPLTAILTINTFANMIGAMGVGVQTLRVFDSSFMVAASILLTVTVLFGGEIIPKTIGATYWKRLAPTCAYIISALIYFTYPVVRLTEAVYKIWDFKRAPLLTRDEMIVTAEIGANDGTIEQKESLVIQNLLKLDQIKVFDVMTPRSVVKSYSTKNTILDVSNDSKNNQFSRMPIYNNSFDQVVGLLHRFKQMEAASQGKHSLTLDQFMVPIHSVLETLSVAAVLDQFIKRKEHLFLVVDSNKTPTGIVTLEDAIETLLGVEIVDESDSVVDMRQLAFEQRQKKSLNPTL